MDLQATPDGLFSRDKGYFKHPLKPLRPAWTFPVANIFPIRLMGHFEPPKPFCLMSQ